MIERTIDINGEINEQLIVGVVNELRDIYEYDRYLLNTFVNPSRELISTVTLCINSLGGSVDGFSRIKTEIDKLKDLKINIKTYVTGRACSCAFLILLLGDERDGSDFCMCMNHISTTIEYGKVTANQRLNDFYMELENKYNDFIVERTDIDKEWLIENQEIDQWFNKEDCLELGIFTKEEQQSELTIDECIEYFKDLGIKVVDDKADKPTEEEIQDKIKEIEGDTEPDMTLGKAVKEVLGEYIESKLNELDKQDVKEKKECIETADCELHNGEFICCYLCKDYSKCDCEDKCIVAWDFKEGGKKEKNFICENLREKLNELDNECKCEIPCEDCTCKENKQEEIIEKYCDEPIDCEYHNGTFKCCMYCEEYENCAYINKCEYVIKFKNNGDSDEVFDCKYFKEPLDE